jgi:hypothetical protein
MEGILSLHVKASHPIPNSTQCMHEFSSNMIFELPCSPERQHSPRERERATNNRPPLLYTTPSPPRTSTHTTPPKEYNRPCLEMKERPSPTHNNYMPPSSSGTNLALMCVCDRCGGEKTLWSETRESPSVLRSYFNFNLFCFAETQLDSSSFPRGKNRLVFILKEGTTTTTTTTTTLHFLVGESVYHVKMV